MARVRADQVDARIARDVDRRAGIVGKLPKELRVVFSPGEQARYATQGLRGQAPPVVVVSREAHERLFVPGDDLVSEAPEDAEHELRQGAHALGEVDAPRKGRDGVVDEGARSHDHAEAALGRGAGEHQLGVELANLALDREDQGGLG